MAGKECELEDLSNATKIPEEAATEAKPSLCKRVRAFLFKNYLPLLLIILVVFGFLVPTPGVFLSKFPTHYVCIVGLFLHSGIKLRTGEIKDSLRAYKVLILNIIIIMFLTTTTGVKLTGLLPFGSARDDEILASKGQSNGFNWTRNNNTSEEGHGSYSVLGPEAFRTGIQMYFIVPCTISAGVVMVAQAGGNSTLALMTTVICNIMGVFTTPLMIDWLMSFEGVKIDIVQLLLKLILTVLLPLLVGKGMRYIPRVKPFVKKYSDTLKLISVTLLIIIPWMKVSLSSQQGAFKAVAVAGMFAILGWGIALHLAFMVMNYLLSLLLRIDAPALKCVVVLASQKSLTVAVTVISLLPFTGAEQGLIALPIIIIHLGVLVLDSVIVTWWHNWDLRNEKIKKNQESITCAETLHLGNGYCTVENEVGPTDLQDSPLQYESPL